MNKLTSKLTGIQVALFILLIGILAYSLSPLFHIIHASKSLPNPPQPEIAYGEFPFKLTYQYKGEQIIVEDIIICKYAGIAIGSNGKSLKWTASLASGKPAPSPYAEASLALDPFTEIYYYLGSPQYYLGTKEYADPNSHAFKVTGIGSGISTKALSQKELFEEYGITIIKFEPSEPIKNTFK